MIRVACLLQTIPLVIALAMVMRTNAFTASLFLLVGAPCLVLGLLCYALVLWRDSVQGASPPSLPSRSRGKQ